MVSRTGVPSRGLTGWSGSTRPRSASATFRPLRASSIARAVLTSARTASASVRAVARKAATASSRARPTISTVIKI